MESKEATKAWEAIVEQLKRTDASKKPTDDVGYAKELTMLLKHLQCPNAMVSDQATLRHLLVDDELLELAEKQLGIELAQDDFISDVLVRLRTHLSESVNKPQHRDVYVLPEFCSHSGESDTEPPGLEPSENG
jgi:hypothetical protein